MTYKQHLNPKQTPQSEPIPGQPQVANSAGGFVYQVDNWDRLQRFLILGAEGGTYYATEQKLTLDNANVVMQCIKEDGVRTVSLIAAISLDGRAPKNEPAILALALCIIHGNEATRGAAYAALPKVCRIGTHLMHLVEYLKDNRGWGRGLRTAVGKWYADKKPADLAYEVLKYQQRDGWSSRDLLRLSHPKPPTEAHRVIFKWMTKGWEVTGVPVTPDVNINDLTYTKIADPDGAVAKIWAFEQLKKAASLTDVIGAIEKHGLPREAIPTQWLKEAAVWKALLPTMGMTALLRNLATMTRVRVFDDLADLRFVIDRLKNKEALKKARIHPVAVLTAQLTYAQGYSERGDSRWTPIPALIDALNDAFYLAFGAVTPTNKRLLLALDVSGSMDQGSVAGVTSLTPRKAVAAMALVTQAVELGATICAFTNGSGVSKWAHIGSGLTPLSLSSKQRLDDVASQMAKLPMGGTDCALPMVWALENRKAYDAFVVYTDNETWAGPIHPVQALRQYRAEMNIPAKLIVVAMTPTPFTIADPNDAGMLDVVGFDAAAPQVMSDFISASMIK